MNVHVDPKKLNKYEDPILTFFDANGSQVRFKTTRKKGMISSDVSTFVKMKGIFAKDRYLYLIMGNQTQGTFGAARLFGISSPYISSNYDHLRNKVVGMPTKRDEFGIIFRVEVIQEYVEPVELNNAIGLKVFTTRVMKYGRKGKEQIGPDE